MFDALTVTLFICLYVGLLLVIALWGERRSLGTERFTRNGLIYTLSIAVYCTSWTFYGSVGKAATSGILFLTIYLGPALCIIFWWTVLRKLVRIKNKYRITSIADFISSRYNKSQLLAAITTVIALVGIVPYIALQLKAVISTFNMISISGDSEVSSWIHSNIGPLTVILMIGFTILFGVRRLDPTERHQGMMLALASECVIKLVAFMAAGVFVTYFMFDGFGDIFRRAAEAASKTELGVPNSSPSFVTWTTFTILSMSAILFLPRQFHVAVVENSDENHIKKAQWMFPLYMLLINLFVIPIALGGLILGNPASSADGFVLSLPLSAGAKWLSMFVFIGGFSAATGMIMISSMTMSTMVTNHLILPVIERINALKGLRRHLLRCRWVTVVLFVFAGYGFTTTVGDSYMLVNMGMMSFAAVLQFAPAILGGLFWNKGNRIGAISGLTAGFALWVYTLLTPAFARSHWLPISFVDEGPWGMAFLRPEQLFGLTGLDKLTHAVFWTMLFNIGFYVLGSVLSRTSKEEQATADDFISILHAEQALGAVSGLNPTIPLKGKRLLAFQLFSNYLTPPEAQKNTNSCLEAIGLRGRDKITVAELADLQSETERVLSGLIGAAAAHHAVQGANLFTRQETEKLSSWYSDILAELKVKPEQLREKVNFYQERASLMKQNAQELEQQVEERTNELVQTNQQLKSEINERKKIQIEREKLHEELIETSRKVGMAEVATSVLHNVGNVLNSINVTSTKIREDLNESKIHLLNKAVGLMERNAQDFVSFFTKNPKGKMLPEFLMDVDKQLSKEHQSVQKNVNMLQDNIDHIKEIINTQQSFAKVGGVSQAVSLNVLIEDAIRINISGLNRHHLKLVREFDEFPEMLLDKTKVVQILVNLISNAKYAVTRNDLNDRVLIIKTVKNIDGFVEIRVEDNGVGIPKENLTNIFQHGFTTKEKGHGFGLHTSALAAKELGGALTVHSDGPGCGSTFSLTIPIERPEKQGRQNQADATVLKV